MILRNYTPFSPLFFESRDVQGRDFGVLVLRGTFDIVPGAALRPSPEQLQPTEEPQPHLTRLLPRSREESVERLVMPLSSDAAQRQGLGDRMRILHLQPSEHQDHVDERSPRQGDPKCSQTSSSEADSGGADTGAFDGGWMW